MFSNFEPKFKNMPENFDYIIEGDSKGYEWFEKDTSI